MGIPVSRLGDTCSGHACFPPRPITGSVSGNILIEGKPAAYNGSILIPHVCPNNPPHPGSVLVSIVTNVMINGSQVAKIGDSISCGGNVASGAGTVVTG